MKLWLGSIGVCVLLVVGVFMLTADTSDTSNTVTSPDVYCPTDDTFNATWNQWSYEYINSNPNASVDEQMDDWNTLMVQNNCDEQWLDPLADLIEQLAASATPVYWYDSN